jgi:hypothetical protein
VKIEASSPRAFDHIKMWREAGSPSVTRDYERRSEAHLISRLEKTGCLVGVIPDSAPRPRTPHRLLALGPVFEDSPYWRLTHGFL